MSEKKYPVEKVDNARQALTNAPTLPPKFIGHDDTIASLSKQMRDLHNRKNYTAREITQMLKDLGIRTTLKEVREVLQK